MNVSPASSNQQPEVMNHIAWNSRSITQRRYVTSFSRVEMWNREEEMKTLKTFAAETGLCTKQWRNGLVRLYRCGLPVTKMFRPFYK